MCGGWLPKFAVLQVLAASPCLCCQKRPAHHEIVEEAGIVRLNISDHIEEVCKDQILLDNKIEHWSSFLTPQGWS